MWNKLRFIFFTVWTFVIYFYLFLDFRIGDFTLISILCEIFLHAVSRMYHLSWVTLYMWQVPLWDYLPPLLLSSYFYQASSFGLSNWSMTSSSKYRDQYLKSYIFSLPSITLSDLKESLKRFFEGNYKWVGKNIFTYLGIATNISISSSFLIEKSLRRFFQL